MTSTPTADPVMDEMPDEPDKQAEKQAAPDTTGPTLVRSGGPAEKSPRTTSSSRSFEIAALVFAVLLLAFSVVTFNRAQNHDSAEVARAELRDRVLISARGEIETLNSMSHTDVQGNLDKWLDATTGTLKDQIASIDESQRAELESQKLIVTAKVVDAAVSELTDDTATVVAAVESTVRDDSGDPSAAAPVVRRNRYAADLVRVGGRWLLENLVQVKVEIR